MRIMCIGELPKNPSSSSLYHKSSYFCLATILGEDKGVSNKFQELTSLMARSVLSQGGPMRFLLFLLLLFPSPPSLSISAIWGR